MIKQTIESDIKNAMLAGDKQLVSTLRTIKSVILDAEIREGARDKGLPEEVVVALLQKEAKKRSEASELYANANDQERADKELYEKDVLQKYLPEQLDETAITGVVNEVLASMDNPNIQMMGQVIGAVKARTGASADGAVIARIVKERLAK